MIFRCFVRSILEPGGVLGDQSIEKVMGEARRLEREGIAKIDEHIPTLILNVPDHRNEEMVIAALARLTRNGFVTDFKSERVNK